MALENNSLFDLIKSLTPSEKKFITSSISSNKVEKPIYLQLFNLINKQKEYDETKIKKSLKQYKITKQFPFLKNYLYNQILERLYRLNKDKSFHIQIFESIQKAQILFDKRLFKLSLNELNRAEKLSHKNQYLIGLILINELRLNLFRMKYSKDELLESGNASFRDTLTQITKLANEIEFDSINFNFVNTYLSSYRARNEKDAQKLTAILENKLLQKSEFALTGYSLSKFHNIHGVNAIRLKDFEGFYNHTLSIYNLYRDDKLSIDRNIKIYIAAVYNHSKSLVLTQRFEAYKVLLEQLNQTIQKNKSLIQTPLMKAYWFSIQSMMNFTYYISARKISLFYKELLPQIVDQYEEHKQGINQIDQIHFIHQFTLVYFLMDNFEEALVWNNYFLEHFKQHEKSRWYLIAKIKNLILHYELQNFEYLPYVIRSTYRFISKRESKLKFENEILQFLRKSSFLINKKELHKAFAGLKVNLIELSSNSEEDATKDFPYLEWLEYKLTGKSMIEMYEGKK